MMPVQLPKSYRRYPTGLKLQYAAGLLNRAAAKSISRSTRRRWKNLTAASFYVPPDAEIIDIDSTALMTALIENRRLKQLLRLKLRLILIYRQLLSEAMNKISKHRYRYQNVLATTDELQKLLPTIIAGYNHMPQACLSGLTPNEVLQGAQPDKMRWREQIAVSCDARLVVNQKASLDNC